MSYYAQHPLSAAFPALSDAEYQALKDSIMNLGVQNAITLYEGQVLDGWNRYRAACELDMDCPARELDGWIDPREFVLAQNKARRHVTQAQLALATAAVYEWRPLGANQSTRVGTECPPGKSTAELAEISGVGERTIKQAKAVLTKAAPEVVEAVRTNEIGLAKASAIAKLPQDQQAEAIHKPLREIAGPAANTQALEGGEAAPEQTAEAAASTAASKQPHADSGASARIQLLEEEVENLREALAAAREEIESTARVLDANDQVAQALKEAESARSLARGLQARVNSLITQVAELKRKVAHWKKKAEG